MNKEQNIIFRVSDLEKGVIELKAEETGLSVSAYCRKTALGKKIGFKLTSEEIEIYRELHKYQSDLTRISNFFKVQDPGLANLTRATAEEIKKHLEKFK